MMGFKKRIPINASIKKSLKDKLRDELFKHPFFTDIYFVEIPEVARRQHFEKNHTASDTEEALSQMVEVGLNLNKIAMVADNGYTVRLLDKTKVPEIYETLCIFVSDVEEHPEQFKKTGLSKNVYNRAKTLKENIYKGFKAQIDRAIEENLNKINEVKNRGESVKEYKERVGKRPSIKRVIPLKGRRNDFK